MKPSTIGTYYPSPADKELKIGATNSFPGHKIKPHQQTFINQDSRKNSFLEASSPEA